MDRTPEEYKAFLENRGYKEYKPGPFTHDGIRRCFQKRFTDQHGTRYFVNVHEWEPLIHPQRGEIAPVSYEYEVTTANLDKEPVQMLFYAGWTIEKVEEYMEKMFDTGLFAYYERDEEEA